MFLENCKILENKKIGFNYYLMKIKCDKSSNSLKAGQFYMLKLKNEARILRRPISVHYVDREKNVLEFYYEVKGGGTKEISTLSKDDMIDVQGPLGRGFSTDMKEKNCLLVGGGMGLAPLKLLIEELKLGQNKIILVAGARDKEALNIMENFNLENVEVYITTDDGSLGEKGNVLPVVSKLLEEKNIDIVQTCGPSKMMMSVANIVEKKEVLCEVSLEERMACGVKACVGCSIKTVEGMKKVCHDGPVFDSKIILKNEL